MPFDDSHSNTFTMENMAANADPSEAVKSEFVVFAVPCFVFARRERIPCYGLTLRAHSDLTYGTAKDLDGPVALPQPSRAHEVTLLDALPTR